MLVFCLSKQRFDVIFFIFFCILQENLSKIKSFDSKNFHPTFKVDLAIKYESKLSKKSLDEFWVLYNFQIFFLSTLNVIIIQY